MQFNLDNSIKIYLIFNFFKKKILKNIVSSDQLELTIQFTNLYKFNIILL
jgi:hypothetical protein